MNRRFFHNRRSRQGVVLLEVVTALFIFTMVSFSLILALDSAFTATSERNEADVAIRGLEDQLELLHSGQIVPTDKDLPDDGTGISYHLVIEVEQMQDQKNQPVAGMYRATVTAKWKSGDQAVSRSISELLYQP